MRAFTILAAATTAAALLLSPGIAVAQAAKCVVPPELRLERPDPAGTPTRVSVGVFILDLPRINEREGTFDIDMFAAVEWTDPRLSAEQLGYSLVGCRIPMADVWNPAVRILNRESTTADAVWHPTSE